MKDASELPAETQKKTLKLFEAIRKALGEEESDSSNIFRKEDSDKDVNPANQSTQNSSRKPERKPPQETHANRNAETRLHVTMSDQTEISHDRASDTFCDVLKRFGFENVHKIERGIVSKHPFSHGKHKQIDEYWINVNNGTIPKKKILDRIAQRLGISIKVEIIPK